MKRPVIRVTSADIKYAEVAGIVTVGEETAAMLSKKLGRRVEVGETFDLGTLAVYHKNPIKRFLATLKIKKNILN
jgi:hypothetical protein